MHYVSLLMIGIHNLIFPMLLQLTLADKIIPASSNYFCVRLDGGGPDVPRTESQFFRILGIDSLWTLRDAGAAAGHTGGSNGVKVGAAAARTFRDQTEEFSRLIEELFRKNQACESENLLPWARWLDTTTAVLIFDTEKPYYYQKKGATGAGNTNVSSKSSDANGSTKTKLLAERLANGQKLVDAVLNEAGLNFVSVEQYCGNAAVDIEGKDQESIKALLKLKADKTRNTREEFEMQDFAKRMKNK